MKARNINEVTHEWVWQTLNRTDVAVDATAGNGHDTLFLSTHAQWVYAFDINKLAIERTQEKTKNQSNITLIHDSHVNLDKHIKEKVHGIMYNCGYLPHSNYQSMTQTATTIASLNQAKYILVNKGWICITVYIKHKNGAKEAQQVEEWLVANTTIEQTYTYPGIEDAPIAYFARTL